jgi:hypothetical protein
MKLKNFSVMGAAKKRNICGVNASAAALPEKTDFEEELGILELEDTVPRAIPCLRCGAKVVQFADYVKPPAASEARSWPTSAAAMLSAR